MFHFLAALDALNHTFFFGPMILGDDEIDGLSNRFARRVSEHSLCGLIPGIHAKIQILAEDGVIAGLNNGGKLMRDSKRLSSFFFEAPPFRNISENQYFTAMLALRIFNDGCGMVDRNFRSLPGD